MTSLNFVRIAFVALLGVGLAACPPVTSKTPVGTTVKAVRDPALIGVWHGKIAHGDDTTDLTLFPQNDGTITALMVNPPTPKDDGGFGVFAVQTVTLGANHYINARELTDDGKPATGAMADNTIPILYRIRDDGSLVLYLMDEDAAKAAIKAGKILGIADGSQFGNVTLTAAPAALDTFLASPAGRALFTKPFAVFRRVK